MTIRLNTTLCCFYTLLLAACGAGNKVHVEAQIIDCAPIALKVEVKALEKQTACGEMDSNGLIHINADTMKLIDFVFKEQDYRLYPNVEFDWHPEHLRCLPLYVSGEETSTKYIYSGSAYINRQGLGRFSNAPKSYGCNMFNQQSGLAQTYINNKAAFFDKDLKVVIRTDYPFLYGDIVCSELPQREDIDHWEWFGGQCGRIDSDYNIVVPMKYPFEKVPKR